MMQPLKTATIFTFFLFIITPSLAQNIGGDVKMKGKADFKVAYVNTSELIKGYVEMKEVEEKFNIKSAKIKKELDFLAEKFQKEVQNYQQEMISLNTEQRNEKETHLMQEQKEIQQQQKEMADALKKESDIAINAIVEKVKAYVNNFGKKNNYTFIFGSNESANIMYAKEGLDITDIILEELNVIYLYR